MRSVLDFLFFHDEVLHAKKALKAPKTPKSTESAKSTKT